MYRSANSHSQTGIRNLQQPSSEVKRYACALIWSWAKVVDDMALIPSGIVMAIAGGVCGAAT